MSGFARPYIFKCMQISLMLLQRIWSQFKIWCFLKEIAPVGTKKVDEFLSHYMPIFNLHVDGQCLKISQLVLLKICDVKSKYIYLALICVLSAYIEFWI